MADSVVEDGPVPDSGVAGVISGFACVSSGISSDRTTDTRRRVREDSRAAASLVARW
jgi:hypothetical protein